MTISTRATKLAIFMAGAAGFLQPAQAYHQTHHLPTSHPVSQDVQPSADIDERVASEVAKAKQILDNLGANNYLASPYLVSAIYYHDGFLTDFPADRNNADPERRIIGRISNMLSPELKARFVLLLHESWARTKPSGPARYVEPVDYSVSAGGRRSHKYAIDLFAPEGGAVRSVSRGVVILADRGWTPENLFSTTSRKGGNAVIIFDPDEDRFYRYCHLSSVQVSTGQIVGSGRGIGAVGHTGLNASRRGHGQHLHFEANEYRSGHVSAMEYGRLRTMLRRWRG